MRRYESRDLEDVVEAFRSNIPKYFVPSEEAELRDFLDEGANDYDEYYVAEIDGEIIGAGGVALNKDQTVSLCWGMIRADHLGTGKGLELTRFRIQKAHEKYGPLPIVISTSQHTRGFYEKLGFILTKHVPDGFGTGIDICEMRRGV